MELRCVSWGLNVPSPGRSTTLISGIDCAVKKEEMPPFSRDGRDIQEGPASGGGGCHQGLHKWAMAETMENRRIWWSCVLSPGRAHKGPM